MNASELPAVEKLAYTVDETCESICVSRTTLWRLVKRDLIRPVISTSRPIFSKKEIQRFLDSQTKPAA